MASNVFFVIHVLLHVFGYLLPQGVAMLVRLITCRPCRHRPTSYIYHPSKEIRVINHRSNLQACQDVFGLVDVKSSVLEDRQYCCDNEEERKALKEAARRCMLEYDAPQYNGHIGTIMGSMRESHRVPYKREAMVAWDGCPVMLDWLYVHGDPPVSSSSAEPAAAEELQQQATTDTGSSTSTTDPPRAKGVCLIFPGLSSHSQSNYVQSMVRTLHRGGYHCCVYNTRGMGDTPLTRNFMFNGAYTRDARDCIRTYFTDAALRRRFGRTMPVVGIGLSLGGVTLSKYLGEEGREGGDPCLDAAITCCSPNDFPHMVEHVNRGFFQKWVYQDAFCDDVRNYVLRHNTLRELPNVDNDYVFQQGNIHRFERNIHFDAHIVAKSAGYRSLFHYHMDSSPVMWVPYTPVPLLVISTMDDPVVGRPVMPHRWQEIVENNPRVVCVESRVGGHLGFLGGPYDEAMDRPNWLERFVLQRVEAVSACWYRVRDAEEEAQRCSMLSPVKGAGGAAATTGASDSSPPWLTTQHQHDGAMALPSHRSNNHMYFTTTATSPQSADQLHQRYFSPKGGETPSFPTNLAASSSAAGSVTPGTSARPFAPIVSNCDYFVDPRLYMLGEEEGHVGGREGSSLHELV